MNQFQALSKQTVIVADTGDLDSIKALKPTDATTNPSLLLKAAALKQYQPLVDAAVQYGQGKGVATIMDKLAVNFGAEITKVVPGVVSTEVDARLSFSTAATIHKAHELIAMYEELGISRERILIKIASTWEGIRAAEQLEKEGIHCNMTLLFSHAQAVACAEAGVTLISPFVGRILDWNKKNNNRDYAPHEDPGVLSVSSIYNYYKRLGYKTVVMGASFRSKGEVLELAGCDKLTIAPKLLDQLLKSNDPVPRKLRPTQGDASKRPQKMDESTFRWAMNEDPMATEKLAEGIRNFAKDTRKLEKIIRAKL